MISGVGLVFFTLFIYFFTLHPATKIYSLHLLILSLLLFLSIFLFKRQRRIWLIYSGMSFVLLLVGISGWFFSPFFSWLYILAIVISFLFNQTIATLFVGVLIAIFLPNVGSVDFILDILTLFSLFFMIPLTYFLRLEYLRLKESEKGILILKQENQKFKSILNEVLSNRITKFAVQLRESLNDVRQLSHYRKQTVERGRVKSGDDKIIILCEKGLQLLKKFEEEVTGVKLLKTPKKVKS